MTVGTGNGAGNMAGMAEMMAVDRDRGRPVGPEGRSAGRRRAALASAVLMAVLLAGCSERERILPGERLDLRASLDEGGADRTGAGATDADAADRVVAIRLPQPLRNKDWPQRHGGPTHNLQHLALSAAPAPLWSAPVGAGNSRKHRITADPVVAGGRVFTLDSRATVMAHSTAGRRLWTRDVTPPGERAGDASGGGLAIAGGTLFVTSGFGELLALDALSGDLLWRQRLDAPVTGAPAVRGDLVYVVTRDNRAWAIGVKHGRIRWELPGVPADAVMSNAAAPAVTERFVIFPFGTGEVTAAFRKGGVRIWRTPVAGRRKGQAYAMIRDITSDPVVAGDVVYAGNAAGRVVALELGSGERIWTASEGAYSPVWPVGGSVFLVSDQDELVRLDAATGKRIWGVQLPYFTKDKPHKRKAIHAHYGPVLAGGRLLVASSDGVIRAFSPQDGSLLASVPLPGGAASHPVIADGVLYVVTQKGRLHAFR